jgi:hypothetical protein
VEGQNNNSVRDSVGFGQARIHIISNLGVDDPKGSKLSMVLHEPTLAMSIATFVKRALGKENQDRAIVRMRLKEGGVLC